MTPLSESAIALIHKAVDKLFDRAKSRFIGKIPKGTAKGIIVSLKPDLSVPGLFNLASEIEKVKPNKSLAQSLINIGVGYLDSTKEKAKAKIVQEMQSFLMDNPDKTEELQQELSKQLDGLMESLGSDVKRIVETETTTARNMSILDGITKVNLSVNIKDPNVFFIIVKDGKACDECVRLHLLEDKTTPRVYKLSEVGSGYHKRGDSSPKASGLHPHCRCVISTLMPGFGFSSSGTVEYKEPGWDEYKHQKE